MDEKCFCHFNGFQVKDAVARKAIEELTAADVGAAPSGFGLGSWCVELPEYDWNNAIANGWYAGKLNAPDAGWWFGSVSRFNETTAMIVQRVYRQYSIDFTDATYHVCAERRGYSTDGGANVTWGEWEYVNPPMCSGIEYRTTERFNGKPVYAKIITSNASASATTTAFLDIPHGIENFGNAVRCTARIGACVLPIIEQTGNISVYWVNATNVRMKLNNYSHTKQLGIDIRYVKA